MTATIASSLWSGTRAELQSAVDAFAAEMEAHKLTVGVPAPLAPSKAVDQAYRHGSFVLESEQVEAAPDPDTEEAAQWRASDLEFIRVIEDLTETLIAKGVIAEADLPAQAQAKIQSRRALRQAE